MPSNWSCDHRELTLFAYHSRMAPTIVRKEMLTAMSLATNDVRSGVRQIGPRKSGKLMDTLSTKTGMSGSGVQGEVKTNRPYAQWVNDGRGPVVAKPGGVLVFEVGGKTVFARKVRAFAGYRFMERGLAASSPAVERRFEEAMSRVGKAWLG